VSVDTASGDQFKPDFLAFSPNNRMPAIIDSAPADGGASIPGIAATPATLRAYARAEQFGSTPVVTEESRKTLFGQTARGGR
jgi:hypothetical protein